MLRGIYPVGTKKVRFGNLLTPTSILSPSKSILSGFPYRGSSHFLTDALPGTYRENISLRYLESAENNL